MDSEQLAESILKMSEKLNEIVELCRPLRLSDSGTPIEIHGDHWDDRILFCVCARRIMAGDLFSHFRECEVIGDLQKGRPGFYAIEVSFQKPDLDQRPDIYPPVDGIVHLRRWIPPLNPA